MLNEQKLGHPPPARVLSPQKNLVVEGPPWHKASTPFHCPVEGSPFVTRASTENSGGCVEGEERTPEQCRGVQRQLDALLRPNNPEPALTSCNIPRQYSRASRHAARPWGGKDGCCGLPDAPARGCFCGGTQHCEGAVAVAVQQNRAKPTTERRSTKGRRRDEKDSPVTFTAEGGDLKGLTSVPLPLN